MDLVSPGKGGVNTEAWPMCAGVGRCGRVEGERGEGGGHRLDRRHSGLAKWWAVQAD